MWDQYTWIFALAVVVGFFAAFGIGANDVANSFASSVGAKALTMPQALLVAAVCEFAGALLLGASVTDTIRSNIAKVAQFQTTPELLMFGMFCVMCAAAFWDNLACHLELPVSTTHTTVGAVIGMALVIRGGKAVVWSQHQDPFPYVKGLTPVFLSWVVSPICSGILATILFGFIRTFVLRSEHSFVRSLALLPIATALTFFMIVVFIIQTGNKNKTWTPAVGDGKLVWIGAVCGIGIGVLVAAILVPYVRRQTLAADDARQKQETLAVDKAAHAQAVAQAKADGTAVPEYRGMSDIEAANPDIGLFAPLSHAVEKMGQTKVGQALINNRLTRTLTYGSRYKVHDVLNEKQTGFDQTVANIWEHAEVFDFKSERVFRYLQVFTACVMSFAHGSNDIANAMGPFSAVYAIWETGKVPSKSSVPTWILALGGAGIVCGLATYGYKIMRVLGVKSVKLTNSRGFSLELATALTVIIASRYGLPVSTTQVVTGAILAMGLFEGFRGVNWKLFIRIFAGWVLTLVVAGLVSGALTAFGVYAPQKTAADDIYTSSKTLNANTLAMIKEINGTNARSNSPNAGLTTQLNSYNKTLTNLMKQGTQSPPAVVGLNQDVFKLYNSTYN